MGPIVQEAIGVARSSLHSFTREWSMLTEEKLAGLASKFGRIKYVVYNGTDLVFRKPARHEAQAFAAKIETDDAVEKANASEQLAQLLVVICGDEEGVAAKQAFLKLLDEWPLLVRNKDVASALSKLTGATQDDAAKSYGDSSQPKASPPTSSQGG
jgi:hypothetical protein